MILLKDRECELCGGEFECKNLTDGFTHKCNRCYVLVKAPNYHFSLLRINFFDKVDKIYKDYVDWDGKKLRLFSRICPHTKQIDVQSNFNAKVHDDGTATINYRIPVYLICELDVTNKQELMKFANSYHSSETFRLMCKTFS